MLIKKRTQVDNREKFSISKKLRADNKSNDLFEIMLNNLTLEEVISLKLELLFRTLGRNIYGIPIWKCMPYIVRDAVLKYIVATSASKTEAIHLIGIDSNSFYKLFNSHGLREYFNDPSKKEKEKDVTN